VPNRGLSEKKIIEQKVSIPNQPAKSMEIKRDSMLNKEVPNQPAKTMGIKSDSMLNKEVPNQPAKTMGIKRDSMLNKEVPNQPAKTMEIKRDSMLNKEVLNQPVKTMGIKRDSMLNKEVLNQPAKTTEIKSDSVINKDVPLKNKTKNIYIILGSCNESLACDKLIRKLKAEGYKAEIVTEKNGVSRIGIVFENLKEARKSLEGIKGNYKTAWILME
jgi:hypothetical protein